MMRGLLLITLLWWTPVQAAVEVLSFDTPEQEQDYKTLIEELRCLVCQNQNLADSNADLAKDLRHQTYQMITEGQSKQEVVDYMVQRYGDFVLYRPPLNTRTYLLWGGPALFLLAGIMVLLRLLKARIPAAGPDKAVLEKAHALLNDDKDKAS